MKNFQVLKWYVRHDYGKEFCLSFLLNERYSFLQISLDISEYGFWIEWPYLQINMGYGRLFSFLLCLGKIGFSFDICGRNWRDESFYVQEND